MNKIVTLLLLPILFFSCSEEPSHIKEANRIMRNFTTYMETCEKFHLSGYGGEMMDDIKKINLTYKSDQSVNIDEARKLFVSSVKKLLSLVNNDIGIRPYLHSYPFTVYDIDLSISFYKKKNKNNQFDYIKYVFFAKGKICYCKYDSEENLNIIFEEPYEEALKIAN